VPPGTGKSPPARKIARLLTVGRHHLCRADAIQVERIEAALPALAAARLLIVKVNRYGAQRPRGRIIGLARRVKRQHDSVLRPRPPVRLHRRWGRVARAIVEWSDRGPDQPAEDPETPDIWPREHLYGRANIDLLRARFVASSYRHARADAFSLWNNNAAEMAA